MKARVRLVFYGEDLISVGSVKITVLRIIGERYIEEPVELGDKPEETLENIAAQLGEGSYVEAIAEAKNQVIRIGVSKINPPQDRARHPIFYKPSRLLKIGVIGSVKRDGQSGDQNGSRNINVSEATRGGSPAGGEAPATDQDSQAREPGEVSSIEWYSPQGEFYVFEGDLRVDGSCDAVVVVTEDGEKIHFIGGSGEGKGTIVRRAKTAVKRKKRRKKARGS